MYKVGDIVKVNDTPNIAESWRGTKWIIESLNENGAYVKNYESFNDPVGVICKGYKTYFNYNNFTLALTKKNHLPKWW